MKKINKIKTSYKIIALAIFLGAFTWVADALIEIIFVKNQSFSKSLLLSGETLQLYLRIVTFVIIVAFGLILAQKVSNLKKIQKDLRDNRNWLYTTIRSIGDAVIATDTNGNILLMNPVAEQLTGWENAEALEKNIHDIFYIVNEFTDKKVEIPVDKVLKNGKIVGLANHTVLISKDNKRINIDDSAAPIISDNNEIIGVILTFQDVTEKKKIYRELQESEEKYRNLSLLKKSILESPQGIIVFALDKEYKYLDFTLLHKKTMKAIWGVDIEVGKNMLDYIRFDEDRRKARINFDRALNGESFILIEEYGDSELERSFYEDRYSPVYDEQNNIIGLSVFVIDITDRRIAEQKLKESEERYRNLFEFSPFPLIVHQDGKIVLANQASVEFMEANEKSELLGLNVMDIVHPDYKNVIIERIKKVYNNREIAKAIDEKFITLKGNSKDVSVQGIPYEFDNKPANLVVFQDITERKIAEQKIKESEEKFRAIFDNIGFGAALLNPKGEFLLVNHGLEIISGYSESELLKMKNSDLSHPDDNKATAIKLKQLFAGEIDSFSIEKRILTKSRETKYGILTVKPLIGSNNKSFGVVGLFVDLSDRKKLELSIEERNKFLNNIFESITYPFYVINVDDYSIVAANSATKLRGDYFEGITCYALTHNSHEKCGNLPEHPCPINIIKETLKPTSVIHTHYNENNIVKYHQINAYPVFNEKGELIQVIESSIDITEKVLAREKIEKLNIELEKKVRDRTNDLNEALSKLQAQNDALQNISNSLEISNSNLEKALEKEKEIGMLKSQFVSMISHEYRTPLTIMLTSSELLERYIKSAELEKMPRLVQRIQNSVIDMEKMLDDVLLLGKSEQGLLSLKLKQRNFINIIEEILSIVNVLLKDEREIILNNNLGNNKIEIITDVHFLKQIIQNILINAHKYSPIEKPIIIDISSNSDSYLGLSITDFGKGISEKDLKNIFEPFFRTKENIGSVKGYGLGLTIVKRLADALNIKINIESELDKFTKFTLLIPHKFDN